VHPIAALQTEYSIFERHVENEILPVCRELGIGFVAYSPLGRGLLTGAPPPTDSNDARNQYFPRFEGDNLKQNLRLADNIRPVADAHQATPAQIALAWLLARGPDVVPIPGTKRRKYLEQNAGAATMRLTEQERARLDSLGTLSGNRYGDMSHIDR
jgi:aryl-alcohol dehydrogenase-like predicted oxidoreductase